MPYYCTVPRCTSMAGKAKNVSFHQFPRDEELARLWNKILKRGKPYTKYSKVCSLHFRPEDYTITSVGKNKGQWRTLRKDAIPSQNLPSESPGPTTPRRRNTGSWVPSLPPNVIDSRIQQQMAQAIYMQTMLAMQAASNGAPPVPTENGNTSQSTESTTQNTSNLAISEIEQLLQCNIPNGIECSPENHEQEIQNRKQENLNITSYKCEECAKCFKDPDVFVLHKRTHMKRDERLSIEKENFNSNSLTRQETLKANPILANLLKSGIPNDIPEVPNNINNIFDTNNILSIENQIMTALAANMENYIRNLSSMLAQAPKSTEFSEDSPKDEHDQNYEDSNETQNSKENFDQDNRDVQNRHEIKEELCIKDEVEDICIREEKCLGEKEDFEMVEKGSAILKPEPNCDIEDLNESQDSNNLVIDETV